MLTWLRELPERLWRLCWVSFWTGSLYFGEVTGLWPQMWGLIYKFIAFVHGNGVAPTNFINFGYEPLNARDEPHLTEEQQTLLAERPTERNQTLLYEKVLSLCPHYPDFSGKDLLEVGCGHGGGLSWIKQVHATFNTVKGMDMTVAKGLDRDIFEGDALRNPLADESVDIVLNVETSHCYVSQPQYYAETMRVLRPGGYHLWADFRPVGYRTKILWQESQEAGFELVRTYDITDNVVASLENQTARTIDGGEGKWYMRLLSPCWNNFWGNTQYGIYKDFKSKNFHYHIVCWRKPIPRKTG